MMYIFTTNRQRCVRMCEVEVAKELYQNSIQLQRISPTLEEGERKIILIQCIVISVYIYTISLYVYIYIQVYNEIVYIISICNLPLVMMSPDLPRNFSAKHR